MRPELIWLRGLSWVPGPLEPKGDAFLPHLCQIQVDSPVFPPQAGWVWATVITPTATCTFWAYHTWGH